MNSPPPPQSIYTSKSAEPASSSTNAPVLGKLLKTASPVIFVVLSCFVCAYVTQMADCATPKSEIATGGNKRWVNTQNLNLRQCPGTGCSIIKALPYGTEITASSETETIGGTIWMKVYAGPSSGWVNPELLSSQPVTAPTAYSATGSAWATPTKSYDNSAGNELNLPNQQALGGQDKEAKRQSEEKQRSEEQRQDDESAKQQQQQAEGREQIEQARWREAEAKAQEEERRRQQETEQSRLENERRAQQIENERLAAEQRRQEINQQRLEKEQERERLRAAEENRRRREAEERRQASQREKLVRDVFETGKRIFKKN